MGGCSALTCTGGGHSFLGSAAGLLENAMRIEKVRRAKAIMDQLLRTPRVIDAVVNCRRFLSDLGLQPAKVTVEPKFPRLAQYDEVRQ
jgi:hypothetical protein